MKKNNSTKYIKHLIRKDRVSSKKVLEHQKSCRKTYRNFVFYGTLMNLELLVDITGYKPVAIDYGFIYGNLYKVTDYTEPHNITTYPLIALNNSNNIIIAKMATYGLKKNELACLWDRLIQFEGPLYIPSKIQFTSFSGHSATAFIFVAKKDLRIGSHTRIHKLKPIYGVYLWK